MSLWGEMGRHKREGGREREGEEVGVRGGRGSRLSLQHGAVCCMVMHSPQDVLIILLASPCSSPTH